MPLVVLEGVDASGKATQAERLYLRLMYEQKKVKRITFPNYKSEASAPVKLYLSGAFGKTAGEVNPYAASAFFAVDRYASYKQYWKEFLDEGGIVIADRYVTSNFIHQASKIADPKERQAYLDFQYDFEYNKLGLPKPDAVIFLDVPPQVSIALIEDRANKFTGHKEHDIHEKDDMYIIDSYNNAVDIAKKYGFITIECAKDGSLLPIEEISDKIYEALEAFF
ncbi:MAG: deoxynucleoside kinase [Bacillota bacterium]|nr:deoxynucleoside kinase [Bacillota bacterium]